MYTLNTRIREIDRSHAPEAVKVFRNHHLSVYILGQREICHTT
jgi:hypothetical protein